MEVSQKEVNFFKYCPKCKDHKTDASKEPCDECIMSPVREGSEVPIHFEARN